jgi:hypothetical protein
MKIAVTIRFTSGREERFEMELWGGSGAQARPRAFVAKPTLLLRSVDEVLVIPGSAI